MNRYLNLSRWYCAALALLLLFTSCAPAASAVVVAQSQLARETTPALPAGDLEALVGGNTAFAIDLYHALRRSDDNLFFSPHSISVALAMTYAGARGNTAEQMARVLHFTLPQAQLHPAFNALDLALQPAQPYGDERPFTLDIANSLWGERDYTFRAEFLDLLARNYGAGLRLTDFRTAPEPAREAINQWVSEQTKERIRDLIPAGAITPDTRLVLANAIYFLADWQQPFDPNLTDDAPFTLRDGTTVNIPMMRWEGAESARYARGAGYQTVELPYMGGKAAMMLIVPDAGTFDEFEAQLAAEQLADITAGLEWKQVILSLPKFTYESEFELSDVLMGLGMTDAFTNADFSGMDGTRNLAISAVIHKAFVAVDEKGTEAAAATAVIMKETSMMIDEPITLTVDRPFIYVIRDTQTGATLFLGRVTNPTP